MLSGMWHIHIQKQFIKSPRFLLPVHPREALHEISEKMFENGALNVQFDLFSTQTPN